MIYNIDKPFSIDLESWLTIHYPNVLLEYEQVQKAIEEEGEEINGKKNHKK